MIRDCILTNIPILIGLMKYTSVASAVKEELKGDTPAKNSNKKTLTKEQILAIKNAAERKKLIAENIHLFDK